MDARHHAEDTQVAAPTTAFYGLGAMGWVIAQRLLQQGRTVFGFDAQPETQARWCREAGQPDAPAARGAALDTCSVVMVCVTDEAASRSVWSDQLPLWPRNALVMELGSVSHAWALQAAQHCQHFGLRYADAPLSGGLAGAQAGTLIAMLGAHPGDVALARTALAPCTSQVVHLGPPGAGQLCKMANQLAIAGIAAGLAHAQAFSRKAGLDPAVVFSVLGLGSAASVQLSRLSETLAQPDNDAAATFAWLRKDLALSQQASGTTLPLVDLWEQAWAQAWDSAWGRLDDEPGPAALNNEPPPPSPDIDLT